MRPNYGNSLRLPLIAALILSGVHCRKSKCVDGKDNLLVIKDRLGDTKKGQVRFKDVKLLTYSSTKQPFCVDGKGALHLPGFVKFISGCVRLLFPFTCL